MASKRAIPVALCALLSSACTLHLSGYSDSCDLTAARDASLEVGDATRVRVTARAGALTIEGRPDLSEVRIAGTACAPSQAELDRIELVTDRSGDDLLIEARTEDTRGRLALVIELPDSLVVDVDDSSGSIDVSDVAAVTLDDSSGSITIDRIAGDVRVRDESGSIDIRDVKGNVTIEDDGSGGIDIRHVRQNVVVDEDGSGGIHVADIGGDFTVRRDGSGSIRHDRVDERVSTPSR
jgi:hypothetical protein